MLLELCESPMAGDSEPDVIALHADGIGYAPYQPPGDCPFYQFTLPLGIGVYTSRTSLSAAFSSCLSSSVVISVSIRKSSIVKWIP